MRKQNCILSFLLLFAFLYMLGLGEEEEEDEEEDYEDPPRNINELNLWWESFRINRTYYPLHCVILGGESDTEVVSLVQNYRLELADISGQKCCFIYFRDLNRARQLLPFEYSEHYRWVYPFVNLVGIKYSDLPCLFFFQQLDSGEYCHISLKDKTQQESIALVREIFEHLSKKPGSVSLDELRGFNRAQKVSASSKVLLNRVALIGRETIIELFKSFVDRIIP